MGFLYKIKP
jgi:hypothetical protein